jgi:hypothetical protein
MEETTHETHFKRVLQPSASVLLSLLIVLLVFGGAGYVLAFYLVR